MSVTITFRVDEKIKKTAQINAKRDGITLSQLMTKYLLEINKNSKNNPLISNLKKTKIDKAIIDDFDKITSELRKSPSRNQNI
jgi:antitoxin component of RelBE/YafQ-DinJ toxin-antitoxin module